MILYMDVMYEHVADIYWTRVVLILSLDVVDFSSLRY